MALAEEKIDAYRVLVKICEGRRAGASEA